MNPTDRHFRRRFLRCWKFLWADRPPTLRRALERTGWTPIPDTVQRRRRSTDARPWEDVR